MLQVQLLDTEMQLAEAFSRIRNRKFWNKRANVFGRSRLELLVSNAELLECSNKRQRLAKRNSGNQTNRTKTDISIFRRERTGYASVLILWFVSLYSRRFNQMSARKQCASKIDRNSYGTSTERPKELKSVPNILSVWIKNFRLEIFNSFFF